MNYDAYDVEKEDQHQEQVIGNSEVYCSLIVFLFSKHSFEVNIWEMIRKQNHEGHQSNEIYDSECPVEISHILQLL